MNATVASFDEYRGYGYLAADDGSSYFFHCISIKDGSRTIKEGVAVSFELSAGHLGRFEAVGVG